jgi:pimeloyl-ACP methyl ester carboxylesterase
LILHTEVFGEGDPIIFLHTGLQTGLTDFTYQREYFEKNYKVFVPDLRGHGQSIESDFSNYFNDSAIDLKETLDHYNVDKVHMVGCSLGALVGLKFSKMFPDRIKTLTLSGIMTEKPDNWYEMNKEQYAQRTEAITNEHALNYFNTLHQSDWKQFISMGKSEDWYPFEDTKDVGTFTFPTLLLFGEGIRHETKGASDFPKQDNQIHVSIIPFASHMVHTEQPELYTRVVNVFIKKYS